MWNFLRRKAQPAPERRAAGFTSALIAARENWITGAHGVAELTATVQGCVTLWESAFALADVTGTDLLPRRMMALIGRAAALRGEVVLRITAEGLVPFADWEVATRDGRPTAYRGTIADAGGGRSVTALAPEVLHLRLGADPLAPWAGRAPRATPRTCARPSAAGGARRW